MVSDFDDQPLLIDQIVLHHPWYAIALWIAVSLLDEVFRSRSDLHYRAGANRHFVREQPSRANAPGARFAFVVKALGGSFFLAMIDIVARSKHAPWLFEFIAGALILTELTYLCGWHQTYWLYRYARDSSGIRGKITYAFWLRLRVGIALLVTFGFIYLVLAVLIERSFLVGGAAGNLALAAYFWRFRGSSSPRAQPTQSAVATAPGDPASSNAATDSAGTDSG
jgi:hypothetical protein